jgi:hypothetical protein
MCCAAACVCESAPCTAHTAAGNVACSRMQRARRALPTHATRGKAQQNAHKKVLRDVLLFCVQRAEAVTCPALAQEVSEG